MRTVIGSPDIMPSAVGRGARVFARALVHELGGAHEGHRPASLIQGQRGIAVNLGLDFPPGGRAAPGAFTPEVRAGAGRQWPRI